jgi:hypothetical protein
VLSLTLQRVYQLYSYYDRVKLLTSCIIGRSIETETELTSHAFELSVPIAEMEPPTFRERKIPKASCRPTRMACGFCARVIDWMKRGLGCLDGFDQDEAESKRDE